MYDPPCPVRSAYRTPRWRCGHVVRISFGALFTFMACTAPASAAAWTNIGPYGGYVRSLTIDPHDPNVLYCGTEGAGVFKSTNAGLTWMPAREGLHSSLDDVHSLAVSPFSPNLVFAGVDGLTGRSTDGGLHWKEVTFRPDFFYESAVILACDPTRESVVYAGTPDNPSLYVSRDAGQTWRVARIDDRVWVWDFATQRRSPGLVFAAAKFAGVYRSTDWGKTWIRASSGLDPLRPIYDVEMSPVDPDTVYAIDGYLYVTSDRGEQWTRLNSPGGVMEVIKVLVQAAGNPYPGRPMLVAGMSDGNVLISCDEGETWVNSGYGLPRAGTEHYDLLLDIASPPGTPWIMYAATSGGVYKTVNGGAEWKKSYCGITNHRIADSGVVIDPDRPRWVAAAGGRVGDFVTNRIRVTADGGVTWGQAMNGIAYESIEFHAMRRASDPGSPIYVSANKKGPDNPVLYRSDDGARSWNQTFLLKKGRTRIRFFEMDPGSPGTLYIGVNRIDDDERGDNAIFRSTDGGETWRRLGRIRERIWCLGIDPTDRSVLYVGSDESRLLLKSTDGGATWRTLSEGLPASWFWVLDLLVDPEMPSVVYANLYPQGLYRSTDRGESWESIGAELAGAGVITALAVDPTDPRVVYVGGSEDILLYKSEDRGSSWRPISKGLTGGYVGSIVINPRDPRNIYLGTFGSGIFVTTTGGE